MFAQTQDASLKTAAQVTSLVSPYAPASASIMYPLMVYRMAA